MQESTLNSLLLSNYNNIAIREEEAYAWLNSDNDNQGSVVAERKLFPAKFIYLEQQCMSPHK